MLGGSLNLFLQGYISGHRPDEPRLACCGITWLQLVTSGACTEMCVAYEYE